MDVIAKERSDCGNLETACTHLIRPLRGHLKVNCRNAAREAALGHPLKGKAYVVRSKF